MLYQHNVNGIKINKSKKMSGLLVVQLQVEFYKTLLTQYKRPRIMLFTPNYVALVVVATAAVVVLVVHVVVFFRWLVGNGSFC